MKNVLLVIMLLGSSACWASEQKVVLKAEERTKPLPVPPTKKPPMLPYPELEMYDVDASEAINFSELDTVELTVSGDFRGVVEDMAELSSTSFDSEEEFSQGLRDPSQLSLIINSLNEEERQRQEEPKGKSRSESAAIRESQVKELNKGLTVALHRVSENRSKLSKDDSWVELSKRPPETQPRNRSKSFSSVPKYQQSTVEPEPVELSRWRAKTEVRKRPVRQGLFSSRRDKRKSPRGKIGKSGNKSPGVENSSSQEPELSLNASRKALSLFGPPEGKSRSESAAIRESQVKELEKGLTVALHHVSKKRSKLSKDDSWEVLSKRPPETQPRNRSRSFSSVPKHQQSTAEPEPVELTRRRTKTEVHKRQGFLHSLRDKRKSPRGKIGSGSKSPRLRNSGPQESALPENVSQKALSLLGPNDRGSGSKSPRLRNSSSQEPELPLNASRKALSFIEPPEDRQKTKKSVRLRKSPRLARSQQAVSAPTTPTLPRDQLSSSMPSSANRSPMPRRKPTQLVAPTPPPRKSPQSKRLDKTSQKLVGQDRPN